MTVAPITSAIGTANSVITTDEKIVQDIKADVAKWQARRKPKVAVKTSRARPRETAASFVRGRATAGPSLSATAFREKGDDATLPT